MRHETWMERDERTPQQIRESKIRDLIWQKQELKKKIELIDKKLDELSE